VTDIHEGDYHLDAEDNDAAALCYGRVISRFPQNPWGYLRLGKAKFREGDFEQAAANYTMVTKLVPAYYGGWLKLAECQVILKRKDDAALSVVEAYRRNRFDPRVANLRNLLKSPGRTRNG
jgi:predicted TPR repeat methyltransferase